MLIARAPLRISFIGGGTDLSAFYEKYPGRVLSTTIDKFVYVVINHGNFLDRFLIKYMQTESVTDYKDLRHARFREAIGMVEIGNQKLEIASFADLPSNTGLGSSSSFSVALLKALHANSGRSVDKQTIAELAVKLEIDVLKEPIGKQDQFAAAYGGLNMIQFNQDGTVDVQPVYIDYLTRAKLNDHLLLFFTGITRDASSVLSEQKTKLNENFETYRAMSDSVLVFKEKLEAGDISGMAGMLKEAWERKRTLASSISNGNIDKLYKMAEDSGSMGGKLLGAGNGGCLLFMAPPEKHAVITDKLIREADQLGLAGFRRIDFSLTQSGCDLIFNSN